MKAFFKLLLCVLIVIIVWNHLPMVISVGGEILKAICDGILYLLDKVR
jgi:hypothetical protein